MQQRPTKHADNPNQDQPLSDKLTSFIQNYPWATVTLALALGGICGRKLMQSSSHSKH